MSISEDELKRELSQGDESQKVEKIQEMQLKVLNDVSYAE